MAGFYKSFFKVSMIFCVVVALSFNALGEQEGFCVDCVKGSEAKGEIQDLSKLTCEAQVSRPECKNVPKMFRPDCDNFSESIDPLFCVPTVGFAGLGSIVALFKFLGVNASSSTSGVVRVTARVFPLATVTVAGVGASLLALETYQKRTEVLREAKQRGLDPKDEDKIREVTGKEVAFSIGKRLYNLVYGDSHCYNNVIHTIRVCGLLAGPGVAGGIAAGFWTAPSGSALAVITGTTAGTLSGVGVSGIMVSFITEYERVRNDVQSKIQAVEDNAPPSATETLDTLLNEASQ